MFARILALILSWLLAVPAVAGPVINWGPNQSATLYNTGDLVAKDGSVYPKYYEKNYLQAGASSAGPAPSPVWQASGAGITCTTTTSNLPDATVGTALAVAGQAGATGTEYCFYNYDIDEADGSKVLKLAFDQKPVTYTAGDFRIDVYSCTVAWSGTPATTCSGTATRLTLSTDDSTGKTTLIDQTGTITPPPTYSTPAYATAHHLQARIGLNGSNMSQMNFAQLLTGPGTVVQSAAVTYLGNLAFTPSAGFGTVTNARYDAWRIGTMMRVHGYFKSGSTAGVTASIALPTGDTIDSSAVSTQTSGSALGWYEQPTTSGTAASIFSTSTGSQGVVFFDGTDTSNIYFAASAQSGAYLKGTGLALIGQNDPTEFWADIPIAQWASSGTVAIAPNQGTFACSTTGTWDASAVAANTVFGPQGCPISGSLTAARTKVVQFSTPIQARTPPRLEYHVAGTTDVWVDQALSEWPQQQYPSIAFGGGISHSGATANSVTVQFNQYSQAGTTYNSATGASNWSSSLYDAWRVEVPLPNQAVGFKGATALDQGLVSYEDSGTFSANFTGARSITGLTITYHRVGKQVTLSFPADTGASCSASIFTASGVVPAALRPTTNAANGWVPIQNNGATQGAPGAIQVSTGGTITICNDFICGGFTNAANCGFYPGTISYSVN